MRWRALITALLASAFLIVPSVGATAQMVGGRGDTAPIVPNRWLDSGHPDVWGNVPTYARDIWFCIRKHESINAGHWTAENPVSTASGAGQWLNSTWNGLKKWVKINGNFVARQYDEAKDAPPYVQDAAFVHVWRQDGLRMWHGTYCPGT